MLAGPILTASWLMRRHGGNSSNPPNDREHWQSRPAAGVRRPDANLPATPVLEPQLDTFQRVGADSLLHLPDYLHSPWCSRASPWLDSSSILTPTLPDISSVISLHSPIWQSPTPRLISRGSLPNPGLHIPVSLGYVSL